MPRRTRKFRFNNKTGTLSSQGIDLISNGEMASGGSILQVKNTTTSSRTSYVGNAGGTTITPITTTITPSATSSKVFVIVTLTYELHHNAGFRLYRDSTIIGRNSSSTSQWSHTWTTHYDNNQASTPITQTWTFLDAPSSTSALSYSLAVARSGTTNYTLYLNRCQSSAGSNNHENGTSSITLMEVAG